MKITKLSTIILVILITLFSAQAATLTCQQVSTTSLSIPQFSSSTIEILCTASGGTVSNIQISPNVNPTSGLTISSTQAIATSISDQATGTAKWSLTGDSPNTYSVSFTVQSDGTNSWSGASTTSVSVPSAAQLTVEYVLPPSIFTPTVDTLDFMISNIGGTAASNVKIKLNNGSTYNYPITIEAGASSSYSWTNSTGFNVSGTYTTYVYLGDVLHDSATTTVNTAADNITQETGWNLISLPRIPTNLSPDSIFSEITSDINRLWSYDGSWEYYSPGGANQIGNLNITKGYWLKLNNQRSYTLTGSEHSTTVLEMTTGWNLLGFPSSSDTKNVNATIQPISGSLVRIWGYNDTSMVWKYYDPINYNPNSVSHLHNFIQGKGYWYKITQNANLTIT